MSDTKTPAHTYSEEQRALASLILEKTLAFGADLAGLASVDDLRNGPSEQLFPKMKDHSRDHFAEEITTGLPHGAVLFEEGAKTAVIYAVSHPREKPELDWWCGEINPPGNKQLLQISKKLIRYLKENHPGISAWSKRYHVERGGIYLKDAAVAAGLGCIGRNNLLVTPEYGPRVRLRAVLISEALPPTGPRAFDPCAGCAAWCIRGCPERAFSGVLYTEEETGLTYLPGRDGSYSRASCNAQMLKNEDEAETALMPEVSDTPDRIIKYCRRCEMACPVGSAG